MRLVQWAGERLWETQLAMKFRDERDFNPQSNTVFILARSLYKINQNWKLVLLWDEEFDYSNEEDV